MNPHQLLYVNDNIYKLREDDQIIGFFLYDPSNEVIAKIQGLLVEPATYLVRYLVFNLGGFLKIRGKTIILPREVFEVIDMGKVKTTWSQKYLMDAPTPHDVENVTSDEEELILSYFDLTPYWAVTPASSPEENRKEPDHGKEK